MLKVRGIFKVLLNILYDELKYSILKLAIIIIQNKDIEVNYSTLQDKSNIF